MRIEKKLTVRHKTSEAFYHYFIIYELAYGVSEEPIPTNTKISTIERKYQNGPDTHSSRSKANFLDFIT